MGPTEVRELADDLAARACDRSCCHNKRRIVEVLREYADALEQGRVLTGEEAARLRCCEGACHGLVSMLEKMGELPHHASTETVTVEALLDWVVKCKALDAARLAAEQRARDLEAELLRVRTTGHGAAHELDNIAVELGLGHSPQAGVVAAEVRRLKALAGDGATA